MDVDDISAKASQMITTAICDACAKETAKLEGQKAQGGRGTGPSGMKSTPASSDHLDGISAVASQIATDAVDAARLQGQGAAGRKSKMRLFLF